MPSLVVIYLIEKRWWGNGRKVSDCVFYKDILDESWKKDLENNK